MYDTVKFTIEGVERTPEKLASLGACLTNVYHTYSEEAGNSVKGRLKNLRVSLNSYGLVVQGSIPKYLFGENFSSVTLDDTRNFLQTISEILSEDMLQAKVTQMDIASTVETKFTPSRYYPYFGNVRRMKRLMMADESILWKHNSREIQFYDKLAEAKNNKGCVPLKWQGRNALRLELRYRTNLKSQFSGSTIRGKDLINPDFFYQEVVKRWYQSYLSIEKISDRSLDFDCVKTSRQAKEHLAKVAVSLVDQTHLQEIHAEIKRYSTREAGRFNVFVKGAQGTGKESGLLLEVNLLMKQEIGDLNILREAA